MPPYLIHLAAVFLFVFLAEQERNEDHDHDEDSLKEANFYKNVVNLVACALNIINLMIFFAQCSFLKTTMFYRPWTYLDII
jgi:FtsH-binding integral membrane protein